MLGQKRNSSVFMQAPPGPDIEKAGCVEETAAPPESTSTSKEQTEKAL